MEKGKGITVAVALLSVYILWGSTYLAIRIAIESFPPFMMAGIRFFITGWVLYFILLAAGVKTPSKSEWKGGAIIGVLLLMLGNGGVVYAEQWVSSGLAALGVATVPLWTVLFGGIWKRWPSKIEWFGVALGFAGVVLLNLEGGLRAHPLGAMALIFSAVAWSFASAWSRDLNLPKGLMASAVEMIAGGAALLILSYLVGEKLPGLPSARSMIALLYLMIFGALVGFSAYTYLLGKVRPALATSYAYVNPLIAVGLGVWAAGEKISSAGITAMFVIIAAVMLVLFGQRQQSD